MRSLLAVLACSLIATASAGQERRASHCISLVEDATTLRPVPVAYSDPVPADSVRLSYIDHSMILIQTEGGLNAVTDYTGFLGLSRMVPDVVTMNNAHSSHWTAFPDPLIPHVLPGWAVAGEAQDHALDLGEMYVRNVPTDIRGGQAGAIPDGNSIFVFEVAGLCIGHLGHLHHAPTEEDYAALGRLDVVIAAVDGGLTLDHRTLIGVLERLRSSVVIPVHWFGRGTLEGFLRSMAVEFDIVRAGGPEVVVSLRTLPDRPTVVVLEPRFLDGD